MPSRPPLFAVTTRNSWLIPPALLCAALIGLLIVFQGPVHLFGLFFGLIFGLGVLWFLISVIFPGRADLTCPECQAETLERLSPTSALGLRCSACDFTDPDHSSWMIAELEGLPLEPLVFADAETPSSNPPA
ncbi:MAG: hypothetical protein ABGY71_12440 [bacterium]|jgi:hypothetical protein|nr:hypothetical protein [Planctomycetota bacterium]HIL51801.1 hypothetical protein [Planctomycetota bacterium]